MFAFVAAAFLAAQPAPAAAVAPDPAVAEITRLEQQWGEAFVSRDFAFIERIVAPEFRLVGVGDDGSVRMTTRPEWMKNSRAFTHHAFAIETVDVNHAGDTAVASAHGLWTVSFRPGQPPMKMRFFTTDTWVRRGGQWQVVQRFAQRLPDAPWPPARPTPPASSERR